MAYRKQVPKDLVGTPDYPSNRIWTVSNVITFCRLVLTAVFFYLFVAGWNRYVALTIYAVAASTDWLDGMIARATKTVSWLGKILDPICDRALLFCGVLAIVVRGELPLWVACFVIGRDVYLFCGSRVVAHFHRRPIDVAFVGKVATALLMSGFTLMLLGLPVLPGIGFVSDRVSWLPGLNAAPAPLGLFLVYAGVFFSFITAVVYTERGVKASLGAIRHPELEEDDFLNPEIVDRQAEQAAGAHGAADAGGSRGAESGRG